MGFDPGKIDPSYVPPPVTPPTKTGYRKTANLDYRVLDGTETVTLSGTRLGADFEYTVTFAEGQDYSIRDIGALGGFVQYGDRRWQIGVNELPSGFEPKREDVLTDANGTDWVLIADGTVDSLQISWICATRKATVAG